MTPTAAIQKFWESFGLPAFPVNTVPEKQALPYITYEISLGQFNDQPLSVIGQIWYHTDSEKIPNDKAREIGDEIGRGGKIIHCDGGAIWITKGSPFCLHTTAAGDRLLKLRQLNVNLEYLT